MLHVFVEVSFMLMILQTYVIQANDTSKQIAIERLAMRSQISLCQVYEEEKKHFLG